VFKRGDKRETLINTLSVLSLSRCSRHHHREKEVVYMKEIPLTQGKVSLVDDGDYERINQYRWYAQKSGNVFYAARGLPNRGGGIYMHQDIISTKKGEMTDHINGNGLDNRRKNLRIVTHRENLQNLHIKKTSKYPGVYWNKQKEKWQTQIKTPLGRQHLGVYSDEETAGLIYAMAYNALKMGNDGLKKSEPICT